MGRDQPRSLRALLKSHAARPDRAPDAVPEPASAPGLLRRGRTVLRGVGGVVTGRRSGIVSRGDVSAPAAAPRDPPMLPDPPAERLSPGAPGPARAPARDSALPAPVRPGDPAASLAPVPPQDSAPVLPQDSAPASASALALSVGTGRGAMGSLGAMAPRAEEDAGSVGTFGSRGSLRVRAMGAAEGILPRRSQQGVVERNSDVAAIVSAARQRSSMRSVVRAPPHHRSHGGYRNPWESAAKEGGARGRGGSGSRTFFHKVAKDRRVPDEQLATMLLLAGRPDFRAAFDAIARDKRALASHWLGHTTFVIQAVGLTVLTDPVWSARLGPLGARRLVPPPCEIDALPPIDVVLLSSSSYDHYDKGAVALLAPRVERWLVPLGVKQLLTAVGVDDAAITELDWWQEVRVKNCRVVCTPAQHVSAREDALWCSWVVHARHHRFFYCGGTGYRAISRDIDDNESYEHRAKYGGPVCPVFREISDRLGSCDTAFLPIGGYKPRVLMSGVNGDATDMLFVHRDLRARRSVGHRWGTFACSGSDEGLLDAARSLEIGLLTSPVPEHEFVYLKHGRIHIT